MKNFKMFGIGAMAVCVLSMSTGCFGTFSLTRKVYDFNKGVGGKFVQELVFLVFTALPVYGIAGFVDVAVLNLIEFWTGSNPMSMKEGESQTKIVKSKNKVFQVTATKNNYKIVEIAGPEKGKELNITYRPSEEAWYIANATESHKVAEITGVNSALLYKANGEVMAINR